MKGFWVRMKGQDSWKLLISTDKKLSFINTMRYYQKIFHNSYSFLTASIVAFIVCLLKLFFFI